MAFIRQEKPTKNRDLLNLGLLVFNIMKTTLKVTQSTSRPPWTPYGYRWNPYFWGFWTFMKPVSFSNANSSFKNKNCYNKVTLYPMDLTWKIFFCSKKSKFSTFHFLNLSPAVPNFGASYLPTYQKIPAEIFRKWSFLLYYQFEVGPISMASPGMGNILIDSNLSLGWVNENTFQKWGHQLKPLVRWS